MEADDNLDSLRRVRRLRRQQRAIAGAVVAGGSDRSDEPVFLLAAARSGSTYLQRLINCTSEITLWGEHGGFLRQLAQAYVSASHPNFNRNIRRARGWVPHLLEKRAVLQPNQRAVNTIEWVNAYEPDALREAFRGLLLALFADGVPRGSRWGFKEIRYGEDEARFLELLFPGGRFIYLLRHPVAVLKSQIDDLAKGQNGQLPGRVRRLRDYQQAVVEAVPRVARGAALLVSYESLVAGTHAQMRHISEYLGTGFDVAAVDAIVAETHARGLHVEPVPQERDALVRQLEAFLGGRSIVLDAGLVEELADSYLAAAAPLFSAARN